MTATAAAAQAPQVAGAPAWYEGPVARMIAAGTYAPDVTEHYEKVPLQCYLTTHKQGWLWRPDTEVPLFVSHRRLQDAAHLYPATVPWALDSGAFTELSMHGRFVTTSEEYVAAMARYDREIGRLEWAAPRDMMCEPPMIHGGIVDGRRVPGTGLSVFEHQQITIANFKEDEARWADHSGDECPIMPSVQGWEPEDYICCCDMYDAAGVRLEDYPVVGLGSVCRRNKPSELLRVLEGVIPRLTPYLALHGFGMKTTGLEVAGHLMTSADSASWSYTARREHIVLDGHTHSHCGNCLTYAKLWRSKMLAKIELAQAS